MIRINAKYYVTIVLAMRAGSDSVPTPHAPDTTSVSVGNTSFAMTVGIGFYIRGKITDKINLRKFLNMFSSVVYLVPDASGFAPSIGIVAGAAYSHCTSLPLLHYVILCQCKVHVVSVCCLCVLLILIFL